MKDKREVIDHYKQSIEFAMFLKDIDNISWRTQIDKGKWTIAEVLGHLIPWDEFVIHKRVPYFMQNSIFPKGPNVEEMNKSSALNARKNSQTQTINAFVHGRRELINAISSISSDMWSKEIVIGTSKLILSDYFTGLAKHDLHHFNQIYKVLNERKKYIEKKEDCLELKKRIKYGNS